MKELIKITEHNGLRAVSARELHKFLEVETRFDIWYNRMFEYGFSENADYQCLFKNVQMPNGGFKRVLDDYALSLDCAKEISMLQRSEKGKQARKYFIECEKKLKLGGFALPQTFSEALKLAYEQSLQIEEQQALLRKQAPLVTFAQALQVSAHNILIGEMAKILKQNGVSIGQNRLFEWLREKSYLISKGEQRNLPTQKAMELKLFEVKTTTINNPDGSVRVTRTTKITPKGQEYFVNKFLAL